MKMMRRLTAVLTALLSTWTLLAVPMCTMLCKEPQIVYAADTQSSFGYTNSDNYTADCLSQGQIDTETGEPAMGPLVYDAALSHKYTYEQLAEAYLDDPGLITNSMIWTSWQGVCSGDFSGMSQQTIYEAIIMDYLVSQTEAKAYESQMINDATKYGWDISKDLLDDLAEGEDVSLKEVLKKKTAAELKDTAEVSKALEGLSAYTTIVKELDDIRGSAEEYAKALSQAMALKEADQQRIDFLLAMKEAASDNEDFCDAVDSVIEKLKASREENTLSTGMKVMGKYAVSKAWDKFTDTYAEFSALELGVDTMDLLFNSNDTAANRVKLMLLYTMDQYARRALNSQNTAYKMDGSQENAIALNDAFQSFHAYQEYATNWSRTFITDIAFEGLKNKIKNLFSSKNQQTYDRYMMMFDSDVNFARQETEYLDKWSALYEKIVSAEDVFAEVVPEGSITEMPEDVVVYNGNAYKVFETSMTWIEAEAYCERMNGHLVTITDSSEQAFVESLISQISSKMNFWMGGYYSEKEDEWNWIDNSKFSYTNWDVGQPDFYNEEEFYLRIVNKSVEYETWEVNFGKWNDTANFADGESGDAGLQSFGFICEWDNEEEQEQIELPEDLFIYNGHTYKAFDVAMTWSAAEKYCESLGGHLATVSDAEEQSVMENLSGQINSCENFWLGGYYSLTDNQWKWVDGTSFEYTNWDEEKPDNINGIEYYIRFVNKDIEYEVWNAYCGKWNDADNNADDTIGEVPLKTFGFICEWDTIIAPDHSGDLSRDGSLNTLDAVILQMQLLNTYTFTDDQWNIADVNEDGTVNAFDLAILKRKLLEQ